ncbi:sarcosine oxidase [Mesobacillus campisalis]|uniref:Sarcosine oxidase n=1 Tax=Mesobacillus campisalis TaxID=1408103 RepID=A0A0M2T0L6_9BACI|nr:N-methyl-L-tryptophan oxidase [Mesobacillus campisalis]KKK39963.1 sarcosine oxidase [Mesobacillus campisalis]
MGNQRVAVIGVGSVGSMTLWQLAKRGIHAVGFEQFGIAHDRSAVGGESRMFRTAYMEGADYVPLLKKSRELYKELESETGQDLLNLNGGLMIGPENSYKMKNVVKSVIDFDIGHEILDSIQATHRYPQHKFFDSELIVLDKEAGAIRPELAVFTAAERAEELGATIHRHTEVDDICELDDKVQVMANGQVYDFDQVIITAGPWTTKFFPQLKNHLTPRKIVMTWYPTHKLKNYTPEKFPVFGRICEGIGIFGVPTLEGSMVKIGSIDTFGDVEDPGLLHRDITLPELKGINGAVAKYFTELRPDPVRISVHMDGYTTDEHPVVGAVPSLNRTYIMGGYSGHGFKLAPVMGKIATDLLVDGKTNFNINHFNPSRFSQSQILSN